MEEARRANVRSLAFLGKSGGKCKGMADWEIVIDSQETARSIQEAQAFLPHVLRDHLEDAFC